MVGFIIKIVIVILIVLYILIWLIASHIKSARTTSIRAQLEKEYQEKHKHLEGEFAEKEAAIVKRERVVALQEHKLKSVDDRVRFALQTLQVAEEKERDVERREQLVARSVDSIVAERVQELERREHTLEEIVARRVESDIRGKEKGINDNWKIINREKRTLAANKKRYEEKSDELKKREQEMLVRAKLIADHLGVPLKCILNPREKRLVGKITNELPEERYKLIDLVMSCPDDQVKALLAAMQQFPRNLRR